MSPSPPSFARRSWWEDDGIPRREVAEPDLPIVGELRLTSRQVRPPRYALAISLAVHGLLLIGLLVSPVTSSFGASGPDFGTGMPVALVSGFAAGGAKVGPIKSDAPEADVQVEPQSAEESAPLDAGPEIAELPKPTEDQEAARPPIRAAMALAALGKAANNFEGAVGADASQGGDPVAVSDLLGQIARCMPPDLRPRLPFSRLTLSIDANGRLNVAPTVDSDVPEVDPSKRAVADRVVQAALLCGPYFHPDAVSRVLVLPVDFSQVPR